MGSVYFDETHMSDDARRERLYRGDIFIYSPSRASLELAGLAREMLETAFAPHDPRVVDKHMTAEDVAAILARVKPRFIHHEACKRIIPEMMAERGVDLGKLYFDVPRLRTAYPSHFLSSGIAYAFHPHRDTWYSAPMCQLNWWLPVYPLAPENCMGFYPRYFDEAVANGSDTYNYYDWNAKSRVNAAQHVKSDTREQPKARQPLEPVTVRYIPPVGGIILFSGAQMHETVPNASGVARYSIDFRTVHFDDVQSRRGAPNVDSRCTGTTMRDYLRATDLAHLPEDAIKLYNDGTEVEKAVLYFGDKLAQAT